MKRGGTERVEVLKTAYFIDQLQLHQALYYSLLLSNSRPSLRGETKIKTLGLFPVSFIPCPVVPPSSLAIPT